MVRVSRRVGWRADRFATDPVLAGPPQSVPGSGRQTRLPSLCQSNIPGGRGGPRQRRLLGPRAGRDRRGYTGARRGARLPSPPPSDRPRTGRGALPAESAHGRRASRHRESLAISDPAGGRAAFRAEFRGPTLRIHPFTSRRFHVLLNSLFKVLFNFPSRYLSAIGLVPVFSLRWSLPPALGCIPKQPDSGDVRSRRTSGQERPDTRSGRGPDQEDFGRRRIRQVTSHTPQFPPAGGRGIRCWAGPASLAVTEGILVSFFSSA